MVFAEHSGSDLMLWDDIAAALPELRAHAVSMMRDIVIVERQTGTTTDPVTLEETPTYSTIYSGGARVQRSGQLAPRDQVAGEVEFGLNALMIQAPLSAVGIRKGDRVTVTSVGIETDPDLLGLVATVQANLTKSHPTKRTLVCEEVF